MSAINSKKLKYEGADLEAMSEAVNYYAWIADTIKPYLGDSVVEVGAGAGSFSEHILKIEPREATFIEPAKNMYKFLTDKIRNTKSNNTKTKTRNAYFEDVANKINEPDSFVYINVFEHIKDDLKEIKMIGARLKKDGHLIIFVPALNSLMSEFDRSIGHFRRYDRATLRRLAEDVGLEVVKIKYFDFAGMMPWFVNFKLFRSKKMSPKAVGLYDKLAVPIVRIIETIFPVPLGKNLLLIARKK